MSRKTQRRHQNKLSMYAKKAGVNVTLTALDGLPEVDIAACEAVAKDLGVTFRRRVLDAEDEIESGEQLMVVKNSYHFTERDPDSPTPFIANGDIARLRRIRRFEDLYGFRFAEAVLEFADYDDYQLECKVILDTLHSESPSLTREQQTRLFRGVEADYADVRNKLKRYSEVRENEHYNALQIKMAYAITCHKAQGGQWRAVFVDQMLFGEERMSRDLLRWLYTAITRATHRLYLVNFDDRFFESPAADD